MKSRYVIGGLLLGIILFLLYVKSDDTTTPPHQANGTFQQANGTAFQGGWGLNSCPPLQPCPSCPCSPAKVCPSCDGIPGFQKYGPGSIHYNATPGTYTCQTTTRPGYCVLPDAQAAPRCLADQKCVGFLKLNPSDTTSTLISAQPSNSGQATPAIFYEKTGSPPPTKPGTVVVRGTAASPLFALAGLDGMENVTVGSTIIATFTITSPPSLPAFSTYLNTNINGQRLVVSNGLAGGGVALAVPGSLSMFVGQAAGLNGSIKVVS